MVYHRVLNVVLCVDSRTSSYVHPIYKSLHLLTPAAYSVLSPVPFPLTANSLFSKCVILFHR